MFKLEIFLIILLTTQFIKNYIDYKNSIYYSQKQTRFIKILFNKGEYGEYKTSKKLERLNENAKFLFNVYIPKKDELTEIDIIYISPKGVYVIENKNYRGWIYGKDTDSKWCQTFNKNSKKFFYNPIRQNETHIKYLNELFIKEDIHVDDIYSVICFNNRATLKRIKNRTDSIITNTRYIYRIILRKEKYLNTYIDVNMIFNKLEKYTEMTDMEKRNHINIIKNKYKR